MPEVPERSTRRYGSGATDQRSPLEKDRDRILYSTALRRLASVTQVVGAAEGHVFHNRLTHTLEVAQLARRLAEKLRSEQSELIDVVGGVEPEVAEAAALAHDLGHPPFGHIAEQQLDQMLVRDHSVDDGFEGNAQTFRVLTRLSVRAPEHVGQNLTAATLNAVLKYPWPRASRDVDAFRHRKYGAYQSEARDFEFARSVQPPAASGKKSAEAEIMDWADDIAYAVHDMEDFYRAGFIPIHLLMENDERELTKFVDGTFLRWSRDFRPVPGRIKDEELREAFTNLVRGIRESHPIAEPYEGTIEHRAILRSLTSELISRYVLGAAPAFEAPFKLREPDSNDDRLVEIQPEAERELIMLKQLTWFYVIQRPSLAGQQTGQRRVVEDLFSIFYKATKTVVTRDVLPTSAKQLLERQMGNPVSRPDEELRCRIAADVVSGLSEQQAIGLHSRFTGVEPGSILLGIAP